MELARREDCYKVGGAVTAWPREARAAIEAMGDDAPMDVDNDDYASDDAAEVENDDPHRAQWEADYEASHSSHHSPSISPHARGGMSSPHSLHSQRSHRSPTALSPRAPASATGRASSGTMSSGVGVAANAPRGGQSPQYTFRSPAMVAQPPYAALSPLQLPQGVAYGPPSPLNMPPPGYPGSSPRQPSAGPSPRQPSAGPSQRQPSAGPSHQQALESRGGQDRLEILRAREQMLSAQMHDMTRRLCNMDSASEAYRQLWGERDGLNAQMANLSAEIDALEEDARQRDDPQRPPILTPFVNLRDKIMGRKSSGK